MAPGSVGGGSVTSAGANRVNPAMSAEDPRNDDALLAATATDPEAFAAFYRRHLRAVLAFFLRRTGRRDLAADLAAETFAAALQAVPRYRPGTGSAKGWLFAIASNKLA